MVDALITNKCARVIVTYEKLNNFPMRDVSILADVARFNVGTGATACACNCALT